jgi:hypothetical protein
MKMPDGSWQPLVQKPSLPSKVDTEELKREVEAVVQTANKKVAT